MAKKKTQEPSPEEDHLLTVAEVARMLRMDDTTIRKYVNEGIIEAVRLPRGHIRIRQSVVDAILKKTNSRS